MDTENNVLLLVCLAIVIAGIVLFACVGMWWGLNIAVNPQTVANILTPLILTSAFIERAVEVVIAPWRDPGCAQRQAALDRVNADPTATPEERKKASDAFNAYAARTTHYAFTAALIFGLLAAMVGVRALWPFLDPTAMDIFRKAPQSQQNTFIIFDVVLSAALMAGGASGIHSVVNAFTAFFDASTQKSQNSVNS